jgi:hypothetical protein
MIGLCYLQGVGSGRKPFERQLITEENHALP